MKNSLKQKLKSITQRHVEISRLLSDPTVLGNQNRFRELSKEYAQLEPIVTCFKHYEETEQALLTTQELITEGDAEIRRLAQEEINVLTQKLTDFEQELKVLLLPQDPNDKRNLFLEIRAGAGGNEAALFAGDLFRMYYRFAEQKGWKISVVSCHVAEQGGFKEIITRIAGEGVYSQLKFESGTHRVQRVPVTEAQGRIHTSTCTVAIMPEIEEIEVIKVNHKELRIDTFRASGAGGQHVNKTDSAIRITHLPTGIVVECQDERSQHKNRARALSLLQAKLLNEQQQKQQREQAEKRRSLIGSGDRSERIRTYNYPQSRVTDHRINLTLYKLDAIMEGDLNDIIDPLSKELQAEQLAEFEN